MADKKLVDIMVDIETLATTPQAVVLSIGAVVFDPYSKEIGAKFYNEVSDLTHQQELGRVIDADTVKWWMQQGALAKQVFADQPAEGVVRVPTAQMLLNFADFIALNGGREIQLWGNGSDFDNIIIGSLYDSFKMRKPWSYSRNRCYRTMKRLFGDNVPVKREGVHHNGLDDAITQAVHLQEIFACMQRQSLASTASPEAARTPSQPS